jgi:thiamine phosphate synthase YjbQ (UPF0047 family)
MKEVQIYFDTVTINQESGPGINDISFEVESILKNSGIQNGTAHAADCCHQP